MLYSKQWTNDSFSFCLYYYLLEYRLCVAFVMVQRCFFSLFLFVVIIHGYWVDTGQCKYPYIKIIIYNRCVPVIPIVFSIFSLLFILHERIIASIVHNVSMPKSIKSLVYENNKDFQRLRIIKWFYYYFAVLVCNDPQQEWTLQGYFNSTYSNSFLSSLFNKFTFQIMLWHNTEPILGTESVRVISADFIVDIFNNFYESTFKWNSQKTIYRYQNIQMKTYNDLAYLCS